jgi:hypothetical protein
MAASKQSILRGFEAFSIVAGVIATVFGAFWFMDERHQHQTVSQRTYIELQAKINAMDMRQYAAAKKFYEDKRLMGISLDSAENLRLEFLDRQIQKNEEIAVELDAALRELKH